MWASTPTKCAFILTNCRVRLPLAPRKSDNILFRRWIFVAALLREVTRRSRDGGSLSLMKFHSLSQLRWQRLAAARSRHGSDSPPDCHSLPCRHFATLKGRWVEFLLPLGRCGHQPLQIVRFLHITLGCDAYIAPRKSNKIAFGVGTLLPSLQSSVTAKYKYQSTTVFFSVPAFKLRLSS